MKDEKIYGIIAPNKRPANISDSAKEIKCFYYKPALCKKPPYRANETKAALPMANPFPMAAVVFPAASNPSVLALTYGPISAIYAIPPALSLIGPYPSIARLIGKFDNIPSAAKATP
jgi:hypothetical protein